MRRFFVIAILALVSASVAVPVSAQKVRLRGLIAPNCGSSSSLKYADIYGDGNIAVMGSYNCRGAFIVNVSNPDNPTLSSWYNPSPSQQFLEAIVIGNTGYFGSGIGGDGVHIVNLSNPSSPSLLGKVNSSSGNGHNTIHEMMVFDQGTNRYLLENSNSTGNQTLKIIDVTNPAQPVWKYDFTSGEGGWIHAMHIRGTKLYLSNFTASRVDIYGIANLATQPPAFLGSVQIGGTSNHSSWTNETGEYLYSARELQNGDLRVYDVRNPAFPTLVRTISASTLNINAITPHNPVVMGNKLYVAWYQAGTQVFDISDPTNPVRIGQYDTYQTEFAPPQDEPRVADAADPWDVVCGTDSFGRALPTSYGGNWAVYPFLGETKVLLGDLATGLYVVDVSKANQPRKNFISDYDGDGKTDISLFRESNGHWYIENSFDNSQSDVWWGATGDIMTPGDYDGDGKTDQAIFRPSTGVWWFVYSSNGLRPAVTFGQNGDVPVPADYDADGRTDVAVWRPSDGVWYILQSTLGFRAQRWGAPTDKPLVGGDFEGDGKPDVAVWRPSNGVWYVMPSSSSIPMYYAFGAPDDKPVVADFDGDGRADWTVYRPSTGIWYRVDSSNNAFSAYRFGAPEDIPVPADYDGDGSADITVFRPSNGVWYRIDSSNGAFFGREFGQSGDKPSPAASQPQ